MTALGDVDTYYLFYNAGRWLVFDGEKISILFRQDED